MSETKHEHMADMDKSRSCPYYVREKDFIRSFPRENIFLNRMLTSMTKNGGNLFRL